MTTNVYDKLAAGLSGLMHPFLVPLYAVMILLFGQTYMALVPLRLKLFFLAVVGLNTLLIPALFILLLKGLRVLPDLSLRTRRERLLPMLVVAGCYLACIYMMKDVMAAFYIRRFLIAALGCVLLALVVTYFWQISLHMIASGGLLAMLVVANVSGFGRLVVPLLIALLFTGALASARLWLGKHNTLQVAMGFLGGFAVAFILLLFV